MNELQIFNNEEFGSIIEIEKTKKDFYLGFFYALEFGNNLKIGSTKKPYTRLRALMNGANYAGLKIGRFAISIPHTNYFENEKKLHDIFSKHRKERTELFDISMDEFVSSISDNIEYKFESSKMMEESNKKMDGLMNFLFGGNF